MATTNAPQDLAAQESLVKTSFFDDVKDEKTQLDNYPLNVFWISPQEYANYLKDNHHVSSNILIEGSLLSRSKKGNNMKKRYYALYDDRLVCYKNSKKDQERKILNLKGVKLEVFDSTTEEESKEDEPNELEKQCFFVSRNKKYDILFATTKEIYDKWYEEFKKTCILTYFGKYFTNLKVIGKGTFAKVILSKRIVDSKEFAIKTFDKKNILASKSANRTRVGLINEINIMRNLSHPNIIKLYEVYEGEFHIYLVMELLKGGELFDRIIKKGHYSERDASIVIRKLLWALEYLHQKGIMHRDIKPENLILKDDNEYEIKLADFGLAEYEDKKELLFKRCGTPGYVAPEVLEDKKYDTKVDIFSAGVILYILLTGCSPFYGKSYNEILMKNKSCTINYNFEEIKIKLSEEASDLLKSMLQKNPNDRPTAHQALAHKWILKYMTDAEKDDILKMEKELVSAQENMKKFQEERPNVKLLKPQDIIVNSPLLTGRVDAVQNKTDSPMGSPLVINKPRDSKNISDIHKNVLTKNLKEHPGFNQLFAHKKEEPAEPEIKKPIDKLIENNGKSGTNSPYTASPLGKKPKGSIDAKKVGSPFGPNLKEDSEGVKKLLKKME